MKDEKFRLECSSFLSVIGSNLLILSFVLDKEIFDPYEEIFDPYEELFDPYEELFDLSTSLLEIFIPFFID